VHDGAINCTANIPALSSTVALQNPSSSHVQGPVWAAQNSATSLTTKGGVQVLPSSAGGQPITSFRDIVQNAEINGINTGAAGQNAGDTTITPVTNQQLNNFFYDNNISDATPPVPMDGVGTNPKKPVLNIFQPSALLVVGGTYFSKVSISPSPDELAVAGAVGGAIFSPDEVLAITSSGAADGSIKYIGNSTSLTAKVLGAIDAITTCSNSATPEHTIHVHTAGSPVNTAEPVVACQPATGTTGAANALVSKGFWTGAGGTGDPAFAAVGGSLKAAITYDGCVVPDQQSDAWVLSKHGAPAAVALTATKAIISLKGKGFGDCSLVSVRGAGGVTSKADTTKAYEFTGTIGTKYTNSGNVVVKVPGTAAAVTQKIFINQNTSLTNPLVTLEADGVVTKGMGVGGAVHFGTELDSTSASVQALEGCNGIPTQPTQANVYIGAVGFKMLTAGDAVLEVSRP
jgi:hypothetical protein